MKLRQLFERFGEDALTALLAQVREHALRRPAEEQAACDLALRALVSRDEPAAWDAPARDRVLAALHLDRVARALLKDAQAPLPALVAWEAAFRLAPQSHFLRSLLATAKQQGLDEDALAVVERLLLQERTGARRRELLLERGRLLEEALRQFPAAADAYAEGLVEHEDDPELLAGLSRCLEASRRYEELLAVTRRLLQLETAEGQRALLHTRVANLLETLGGDAEETMGHYRQALSLAPTFEPPAQGLLALAEQRGEWRVVADALKARLKTETRAKERATMLTRLAEVTDRHLKAPATGLAYLERAIREYPRGLSARLLLLEMLCARGEFARAERFATPPDATDAHGLSGAQVARLAQIRARVSAEQGRPEEALECLGVALEVAASPQPLLEDLVALIRRFRPETAPPGSLLHVARAHEGDAPALSGLAYLGHGLLLHGLGRVPEAAATLERAVALWPSGSTYEGLAELHLSLRRFPPAVEAFTRGAAAARQAGAVAQSEALTVRAAQVLADHLGRPEEALALLRVPELKAPVTPEPLLFAAAVALQLEQLDVARECALAAQPLEGTPAPRATALWLALQRRLGDPATTGLALRSAAVAGDEPSLRAALKELVSSQRYDELLPLLDGLPPTRQALGHLVAADALRMAGHGQEAQAYYEEAIRRSPSATPLEAVEGLALLAPERALAALERRLGESPFELRALSVLSTLLAASGRTQRAQRLYQLARFIQDGEPQPAAPAPERFWERIHFQEPLARLLAHLAATLPGAFSQREEAIAAGAARLTLPPPQAALLERICALREMAVPAVLSHPYVGNQAVALRGPNAVLVSTRLLAPQMPPGALLFAVLRGVAALGGGVAAVSHLASYQLDLAAEALRLTVAPVPPAGGSSPTQLLADALELPEADVAGALASLPPLEGAHAVDPVAARNAFDEVTLRAAVAGTGDLVGALTALSLRPPPSVAWRTTRNRWLRLLSRLPSARAVMGYTLAEDLAAQ